MVGERKIVGIWPAGDAEPAATQSVMAEFARAAADIDTAEDEPNNDIAGPDCQPMWLGFDEEFPVTQGGFPWMGSAIGLLSAGWLGFALWVVTDGFGALPSVADMPMIAAMCSGPIAVLLLIGLLAERGSERSVRRHLRLLAQMRTEHHLLADRLSALDSYWRDAQATLATRASEYSATTLDAGRTIDETSRAFEARMKTAVAHAATINEQGDAARRHMEGLIVALPKVDDVARRAAETLREAGQNAYQSGGQLEAQIAAVRHESDESQRTISEAQQLLTAKIAELAAATDSARLGADAAGSRFAVLLTEHRDAALAMLADLAGGMDGSVATVEQRLTDAQASIEAATAKQLATLARGMADAEKRAAAVLTVINSAIGASGALDAQLASLVEDVTARAEAMQTSTAGRLEGLSVAVVALRQDFEQLGHEADTGTAKATSLGDKAAQLVSALSAATDQVDANLPQAIARLKGHVADSLQTLAALAPLVEASELGASGTLNRLRDAEAMLEQQVATLAAIDETASHSLASQASGFADLRTAIDGLALDMAKLGGDDAPALLATLAQAEKAADAATDRAREAVAVVARTAGAELESALAKAIDDAVSDPVSERIAGIADVAENAMSAISHATERLAEQMNAISQSSAALETRAGEIAARLEQDDRDTLARQLSVMTESLQSTAIDLSRVMSTEVSDQSWSAYLKGDRGIFARRAVRLLSASEAREILSRYQAEEEFRALVNRYIHDFEAMLRSLMETRDGSSLSATLLSSDIGKVYVALAQAIERLRG